MLRSLILDAALVTAAQVRYDPGYDNASRSMNAVACSNGVNGLITRYGWQTQGDIPNFPRICAADVVSGWNSPNCGQCLLVTYNHTSFPVLAIDHADTGLVLSQESMDVLTGGKSEAIGLIDAEVSLTTQDLCFMKSNGTVR